MKSQLEKGEEREKVPLKKKELVGGRDPEVCEGEDERGRRSPPPVSGGIGGGLFGGMDAHRDPMDETHPDDLNLILCSY